MVCSVVTPSKTLFSTFPFGWYHANQSLLQGEDVLLYLVYADGKPSVQDTDTARQTRVMLDRQMVGGIPVENANLMNDRNSVPIHT
ncbi:unnamed protein product [Protopolystoma xenopodis]|uniref:Uncharacterized protein n=1 Tax=Protopolystoma xenopodis TaxID=117903 RepID=A0A3S5B6S1_9PLAT|nr:unnamed protein product [Protopolystoma xenopodis]